MIHFKRYLIKNILNNVGMNAFNALVDETRLEIVKLITQNGELTSSEIVQNFKMSAPANSQHLKILLAKYLKFGLRMSIFLNGLGQMVTQLRLRN